MKFTQTRSRGGLRCNKITVVIMSSVQVRADLIFNLKFYRLKNQFEL